MSKNVISMNVSMIGTDDGKRILEVRRTWNEKGKKAVAIDIYPTISGENWGMLDTSNVDLLNHANDLEWGELRMLDLYVPVLNGNSNVNQLQDTSRDYIEKTLEKVLEEKDSNTYEIVILWGDSEDDDEKIIKAKIDVLSMLLEKGLSVKCITIDSLSVKEKYGIHPIYLAIHYSKDQWKLVDFPVKEMLEELEKSLKTDKTSEKKKTKKVDKKVKSAEKSADGKDGE